MLEVRSGPQVPTFRNSTYLDPQVGLTRDLGARHPSQGGNMDDAYSPKPLARNGKRIWIGKGSQTWSEEKLKEKKNPRENGLSVDEDINL
jgi:hypothetical protein